MFTEVSSSRIVKGLSRLFAAAALMATCAAQAALLGRDINGNPTATNTDPAAVFIYDDDRNLTWLRNWNYGAGSVYDDGGNTSDGRMTWQSAVNWGINLTVGTFSGWRLPSSLNADGSGPCSGLNCTDSEMGHIWYNELVNTGSLSNTGPFTNLQSLVYWSGTEYAPDTSGAWFFGTGFGVQGFGTGNKVSDLLAVAVRPGDVFAGSAPEPGGLALLLAGLGAVAVARRRRTH